MTSEAEHSIEDDEWEYYDDSKYLTDFWTKLQDSEDPDDPSPLWLEFFSGSGPDKKAPWLLNPFLDYWRIRVPRLFAYSRGKNCLDQVYDEDKIRSALLRPLEAFIAGKSHGVDEFFKDLSKYDSPSSICGCCFTKGCPIYFCKDCGHDYTCVLCSFCFERSIHVNHRYRIFTSNGGCYCDCGDEEAFREGAYCSAHSSYKDKQVSHKDILNKIPLDVRNRIKELYRQIFRYVFKAANYDLGDQDFVISAKEKKTWSELDNTYRTSNFCVTLCNNDFHSFYEVIQTLEKNLGSWCSTKVASDFATYVNKQGRGVLLVGKYIECASVGSKIESSSIREDINLTCLTLPTCIVAHQTFIGRLLQWMNESLLSKCIVFRAVLAELFFSEDNADKITLKQTNSSHPVGEAILLNDAKVWKEVRGLWKETLMLGVLKDPESKKTLAKTYAKNYQEIMQCFVEDSQEQDHSITSLSVQLFPVPSIACDMLENDNVFHTIISYYYTLMNNYCDDSESSSTGLNLKSWQIDDKFVFKRSKAITQDLSFVLSLIPKKISDKLRRKFISGAEVLLECLMLIQGLDTQTRQVDKHIEYESRECERVYVMFEVFMTVIDLLPKWCKKDKGILINLLNLLLSKCLTQDNTSKIFTRSCTLFEETKDYETILYDVSSMPVSVNIPVHRLLANVLTCFNKFPTSDLANKVKKRIENRGTLIDLINPALNAIVMISQINVGMWKKNGSASEVYAYLYTHQDTYQSPKRGDLVLIQTAAALASDPGLIINSLIYRFGVVAWVKGEKFQWKSMDVYDGYNALVDEFLSVLLAIVCERKSVHSLTESEEIKYRIIHILSVKPMTHSALILNVLSESGMAVDDIIESVAEFKKDGNRKLYHLKDEYLQEYNPFYYFFNREQQSLALENQTQAYKKVRNLSFCPPPVLPSLSPLYKGLRYVPSCLPIVAMLKSNFEKDVGDLTLTSKHTHKLLFLINIGIQDDMRENSPSFLERAEQINLVTLLKRKMNEFEELKCLFEYTISKLSEARKALLNICEMEQDDFHIVASSSSNSSQTLDEEKKKKEEMAAKRRSKIMAQMNKMQQKFAQKNARDLVEIEIPNNKECVKNSLDITDIEQCIAVGLKRSSPQTRDKKFTCILCQEEQSLFGQSTGNEDALIIASYIHKSAVLSGDPNFHYVDRGKCFQDYLPIDLSVGPCITSCGHTMHARCYQKFFASLIINGSDRYQGISINRLNYDVSLCEYLCPICERISNVALPLVPPISTFLPLLKSSTEDFQLWTRRIKKILTNKYIENNEDENEKEKGATSVIRASIFNKVIPILKLKTSFSEHSTPNMEMPVMPKSLNNMCNVFAMMTFSKSLSFDPFEGDHRVLQMVFQICALSIHFMTVKFELNDCIPAGEIEILRSLVRLCVAFPMTTSASSKPQHPMHKHFRSNAIVLFTLIFEPQDEKIVGDKSFLDIDAVEMLILLVVGYSSFVFTEEENRFHLGEHDQNILRLVFLVHLAQVAASTARCSDVSFENLEEDEDDCIVRRLIERFGDGRKFPNAKGAAQLIKRKSLRFLRCAALFFEFYTDIPLKKTHLTYSELIRYLGLPSTLSEFINPAMEEILDNLVVSTKVNNKTIVSLPCQPRNLINLPKDYVCLLNSAALYRCPNSVSGECNFPVLCLICGDMVCQLSHCCETFLDGRMVGGCTSHARRCGADVGIYLSLRDCQITILLDGKRGASLSAPYVDEYGECDDGRKRCDPLCLDEEKYAELKKMWLNNDVPNKISRTFDLDYSVIRINWHSL